MTLRLALCFLFHQPVGEQAERASRICYRGVVGVLRNHPRLKFNLMLSGTLVDALAWFDPAFLDAVRSGLDEGIFRLLGSTYAQSLLLAGETGDNASQIAVHRTVLKNHFNAEPTAFWSPHRTWSPRAAPLLLDSGYEILALEGDALRAAGASAPFVHRVSSDAGDWKAVWEDACLRDRMAFATWFRRRDVLAETIDSWKRRPDADRLFPVYAEDADAFGLWGYDIGLDPRADAAGLDELLDWLEGEEDLACAFLEDAPEPDEELYLEGAVWGRELDRILKDPEAPFHEEGYRDWDDFLARAPRLQHFRKLHTAARVRMAPAESPGSAAAETEPPASTALPGASLFALAKRVYCAHQDRFGAVGAGGRGDPAWEGIGTAIAISRAAELAGAAPSRSGFEAQISDLTGDGEDEILLRSGNQAAVLSPYGGRMLYWFDLRRGQLLIGNPLAVPSGTLLIEAKPPDFAPLPDDWSPEADDPLPEKREAGGERRLVRLEKMHLPETPGPLPVWPRPCLTDLKPCLPAKRRALNDFFSLDGGPEEKADPRLDFRLAEKAVIFLRFFGYHLQMVKRISLTSRGVHVIYRFHNVGADPIRVRMRLVSEVCPDYQALLDSSGPGLEPVAVGARRSPGIKNFHTGTILVSRVSRPAVEPPESKPGILAWELSQSVALAVEPGQTETVDVWLNVLSEQGSSPTLKR